MPLCEKHKLLGEEGFVRSEELDALEHVGLDESGARACSMYQVWCCKRRIPSHIPFSSLLRISARLNPVCRRRSPQTRAEAERR